MCENEKKNNIVYKDKDGRWYTVWKNKVIYISQRGLHNNWMVMYSTLSEKSKEK